MQIAVCEEIVVRENFLQRKAFEFAILAVPLYKNLISKQEFVLSKQFFRAATSIGANASEAFAAQTRRDFVYKMTLSNKEARETYYWLRLIKESRTTDFQLEILIEKSQELIRLFTSAVKKARLKV